MLPVLVGGGAVQVQDDQESGTETHWGSLGWGEVELDLACM